jgi:hypothetical protein
LDTLATAFNGLAGLADQQDKINAVNDETQARLAVSGARQQYAGAVDSFKTLKLGQARAGQEPFNAGLDKIKSDVLATAKTPRQRQMIEQELLDVDGSARRMGASWALGQAQAETEMSFGVERTALIDSAVSSDNPAFRDQTSLKLRDNVRRELLFKGLDPETMPAAFAVAEKAAVSQMHDGVADRMFSNTAGPPIDEINEYVAAYGDEMTAEVRNGILKRLQDPLQARLAKADADHYMGLAGPAPEVVAGPVSGQSGANNLDAITIRAESAGNPTAVSPKGARGLMQVMPATARDPGFGIAPSDGTPKDDVRVGKAYRAKMENRYGGDLSKMWAAYNWGPGKVDKAIADYGDNWFDHAPAETKAYVRKNIAAVGGSGNGYAPQAREWDRSAAYDALNNAVAKGEISPERADRARNEMDRRVRVDEGLLKEKQSDADEAATNLMASMGDGFRASAIPRTTWNNLTPVAKRQFMDAEKKLTDPKPVAANSETVVALHRMAAGGPSDQAKFAGLNLAKYKPYMTAGEYDEIAKAQASTSTSLSSPKRVDVRAKIDTAVTRAKKWQGVDADKDPTEAFRIRRYMEERATDEATKRDLTDADYDRLFRDATRTVKTTGILSDGEKRSSQILSPNYRGLITRSFRAKFGRDPSEDEVQAAWEAMGKGG